MWRREERICILIPGPKGLTFVAGVSTTPPDQLNFPCTMTDLDVGTWMVSGSSVLHNSVTTTNGYACDLDKLQERWRLGIMRKSEGTLHFFVNGQDCGCAAGNVPSGKTNSKICF